MYDWYVPEGSGPAHRGPGREQGVRRDKRINTGFFTAEYLFEVGEEAFTPPPKVNSAVIRLKPVSSPLAMKTEKQFFQLVKAAFNQRRKMLRNAVKGLFDAEALQDEIFNKRAEQLSVQQFAELTFRMNY